ncbi:MAG TPA: hypothetical protein PLS03_10665 [Terrimicrobiaceae bacterium]|nr:hypothetical protein [Terrimicrobiaceae bacterium]
MKTILALAGVLCFSVAALAQDAEILDATNLDAIREKAGTEAVVEGLVSNIGTTKDGGITFINIGLEKKQGFVAVVFQKSYGAFGDGFDKYRDQKVRVSGPIELYRGEQPQIILNSPEQITIVTD